MFFHSKYMHIFVVMPIIFDEQECQLGFRHLKHQAVLYLSPNCMYDAGGYVLSLMHRENPEQK